MIYYQSVEKTQKILQKIEKQMLYKNDLELIENYLIGILHDKNIQSIHLSVEANKTIVLFSEQNDSRRSHSRSFLFHKNHPNTKGFQHQSYKRDTYDILV